MAVLVSAGGAGMGHTRHQILTECHEAFFFLGKCHWFMAKPQCSSVQGTMNRIRYVSCAQFARDAPSHRTVSGLIT
jgi:hypothetical protein